MRTDYRALAPLLRGAADVVVPDLRGFGDSDKHAVLAADLERLVERYAEL